MFEAVAEFARACVDDRPGTVWQDDVARSDTAPQPRTAGDVAADLEPSDRARRSWRSPQIEQILIDESSAQVSAAQADTPLRDMPLAVLTHGKPLGVDGELSPGFEPVALVPGARQVIATNSGHCIQLEQPEHDEVVAVLTQL